jgi:hypothetical protein
MRKMPSFELGMSLRVGLLLCSTPALIVAAPVKDLLPGMISAAFGAGHDGLRCFLAIGRRNEMADTLGTGQHDRIGLPVCEPDAADEQCIEDRMTLAPRNDLMG